MGSLVFAAGVKKERKKKRRETRRWWAHVGSIREKERKGETGCHVGKGKRREIKRESGREKKGFSF